MKFLIPLFVLFAVIVSCSKTFRPVGSNVKRVISLCTQYSLELLERECVKYQSCNLQLYTTKEPVVAVCKCRANYSASHPRYSSPNTKIMPYRNFSGVHLDENAAKEKARAGCLDEINKQIGTQNPDHWDSSIECGMEYPYNCKDGSTVKRTYF